MRYDPDGERFLDRIMLELLELRASQDAEIAPQDAGSIEPLLWVGGAVGELVRARHAAEASAAFRRRLMRATGYLLGAVESIDRRNESHPTIPQTQEVHHERV